MIGVLTISLFVGVTYGLNLGLPTPALQSVDGISRSSREVQVSQTPTDREIATRIERIVSATGWAENFSASTQAGIVTLLGEVKNKPQSLWIQQLAKDTHGVVAVNNQLTSRSLNLDLSPVRDESKELFRKAVSSIPYVILSLLIAIAFLGLTYMIMGYGRRTAAKHFSNPLLIRLFGFLAALPVLLIGLYLALTVTGLSSIAITIIGGTGVLGLLIGLAVKNGLESYLSGLMLSLKGLFTVGDLVELDGRLGYVRELTTSMTTLEDHLGRRIFIPNNRVLGGVVVNFTDDGRLRSSLNFVVPLDNDLSRVRRAIADLVGALPGIVQNPPVETLIVSITPVGAEMIVAFSLDGGASLLRLKSNIVEGIQSSLHEQRVQFIGSGPPLGSRPYI